MCWNFTNPKTYNIHPALFTLPSLPFATPCPKTPHNSEDLQQQQVPIEAKKNSVPRPRPCLVAASTAAPTASSRWATASWPFWAERCSDVKPRSAARWKVQRCSAWWGVFPIRNDAKVMENLGWSATGLGSTGKSALTSHSYQQIPNWSYHSQVHPCTGPVFGFKFDQTPVNDSEWTSKINSWYQIKTGKKYIHKKNRQAEKTRSKGC